MSDTTQGGGGASADAGAKSGGRQLGVLLVCFDKLKAAGKARQTLDSHLKSQG